MTEFDRRDIEIANAIYLGDLNALKELEHAPCSDRMNITQFLKLHHFKIQKKIYHMRPLALIVLGEAQHPGKFLEYKKMMDYLIKENGYSQFLDSLEFYSFDIFGTKKIEDLRRSLPFSEKMMQYLIFLDEHHDYGHMKMVHLLNGINQAKGVATPVEKQEIQKAKRLLVNLYRRNNPRKKLPAFFTLNAFTQNTSRQISE